MVDPFVVTSISDAEGKIKFCPSVKTKNPAFRLIAESFFMVVKPNRRFEETTLTSTFMFGLTSLAPTALDEADFNDIVPEKNLDLTILALVTPTKADFNEALDVPAFKLSALAPVTPAKADFE